MERFAKYTSKSRLSLCLIFSLCEVSMGFAQINHKLEGRLVGSVFDRVFDVGPGTCEKICMERNSCLSYNYNVQTFVCELNNAQRRGASDVNFVQDTESVYNEKNITAVSNRRNILKCLYWDISNYKDSHIWYRLNCCFTLRNNYNSKRDLTSFPKGRSVPFH